MTENHLQKTPLLDFAASPIRRLIETEGWLELPAFGRIGAAYTFVRDRIAFGYNSGDNIPASAVLADGYGQCNTKGTLLMALLRALGIPCRLHGFTIHKALQRGVVPELVYGLVPDSVLHSWVEVYHAGRWINLEGFILDRPFLNALQERFGSAGNDLCGFGAGTDCLSAPPVDWIGEDTYIQKTGINADLGVFDSPDDFYAVHRQGLGWFRRFLYRNAVRHWMNARVRRVRHGQIPDIAAVTSHTHDAQLKRLPG